MLGTFSRSWHSSNPEGVPLIRSEMDLETSQLSSRECSVLQSQRVLQALINSEIHGNVSGQELNLFFTSAEKVHGLWHQIQLVGVNVLIPWCGEDLCQNLSCFIFDINNIRMQHKYA